MNAEKLTQKSAEAIRSAQEIALEYGNPQIEQVHLLWALLQDSEGLIPQLLAGMGVTVPSLQAAVKDLLARQPRHFDLTAEGLFFQINGPSPPCQQRRFARQWYQIAFCSCAGRIGRARSIPHPQILRHG